MGSGAGGGNSSSSFSKLSASAPPFTVGKLSTEHSANPHLQFYESPFTIEAPFSRPSSPACELMINSTRMTSKPLRADYGFSASMSISPSSTHWSAGMTSGNGFGYDGGMKSYYSVYDQPQYDLVSTSEFTAFSQTDHFESLYGPGRVDSLELNDGKWAKRVEVHDGSFPYGKSNVGGLHCYDNQLSQGGSGVEYGSKYKQDTGFPKVSNGEVHTATGAVYVRRVKDKLCVEQMRSFLPYGANTTNISGSSSTYPDYNTLSSYQNLCTTSVDSTSTGNVSLIRSTPTVVIRPPPAINGLPGRTAGSPKFARSDYVTGEFDHFNTSKWKDIRQKSISEIKQGKDSFDEKIDTRFGSQLPNINVSGGFNNVQVATSDEEFSDLLDHQSVVDSPCWKGASSSEVSSFDVQTGTCNLVKKNLDVFSNFDHEEPKNNDSVIGSTVTSSGMAVIGDTGMTLYDVPGRGAVAVHVAEKVLDSPSSQEEVTEQTKPRPVPELDVPTIIKVMNNLSELLLVHVSDDVCILEEEHTKTLTHIRTNLDSCMSKKNFQATSEREPSNLASDTPKKPGEPHYVGTISSTPHSTDEDVESRTPPDYSRLKDEKSQGFSPLGDDLELRRDVDMAKAIKKVLEENLDFDKEMHSEASFFKNLWLEAEANLCSICYKARFYQLKVEMEKSKVVAPTGNVDVAEMASKLHIMPIPSTASELIPKTHNGEIPELSIQKSVCAEDNESPIMDRLAILKSREDNSSKPINLEDKRLPEIVDCNILKSREDKLRIVNVGKEKQPEMVDVELAIKNYTGICTMDQSQEETSKLAMRPHLLDQTVLCVNDSGNKSYVSVPMAHSSKSSRIINQCHSGMGVRLGTCTKT